MINRIVEYFDLFSEYRTGRAKAQAATKEETALWRQLLIYSTCVVGVLVGPYVPALLQGTQPDLAVVFGGVKHIVWSAIVALAAVPAVYKWLFDPKKPLIVQMGFALVAGFVAKNLVPLAMQLIGKGGGGT
jgi:hypothetical protein